MSRAYEYWVYQQLEPDAKVITGRSKPMEKRNWMLKRETREQLHQEELENEQKNDDYLLKHGIVFK